MKKTRKRSKRRARLTTLDILATVLGVIAFAAETLAYTEYISHKDGLLINGFAVLGIEIIYNRGRLPRNFSFASYSRRADKSSYNENDSYESSTEFSTDSSSDSPTTQFPERRKGKVSKVPLDSSSEKETQPSQPTEDNNQG